MSKKIEISERTILFTLITIIGLWFAGQIIDILLILFVSIILMSAIKPSVDHLERHRVPRSVAIMIVYTFLWAVFGAIVAGMIPPLIDQTRRLIAAFPSVIAGNQFLSAHQQELTRQVVSLMSSIPTDVVKIITGLFGNVLNVITMVVVSFYLLMERHNLDSILTGYMGHSRAQKVTQLISEIEFRLGGWVRGELLLMICVGVMTYIGLRVLGLETALPLAILAGMLEIIPSIGPTVSAIPAILIALSVHPVMALSTAALYILIQFFENNFLVPQIMSRSAGVNPLISILGLMIGFRLAGVAGAVLALPLVIVIHTISPNLIPPPEQEKKQE